MDLNYLKVLLTDMEEAQFNAAFGNLEDIKLDGMNGATYNAIHKRRANIEREFKEFRRQAKSLVKSMIREIEKQEGSLKVRECKCGRHITDRPGHTCMSCQELAKTTGARHIKLTPEQKAEKKLKKDEEHLHNRIKTFWSKVEPEGDCWIWQAGKVSKNELYGVFRFPIKECSNRTHRIAFWLTGNVLIKGMEICHTCDNPSCVRPSHLWQGTHVDNVKDMHLKGRGSNQHKKAWNNA